MLRASGGRHLGCGPRRRRHLGGRPQPAPPCGSRRPSPETAERLSELFASQSGAAEPAKAVDELRVFPESSESASAISGERSCISGGRRRSGSAGEPRRGGGREAGSAADVTSGG